MFLVVIPWAVLVDVRTSLGKFSSWWLFHKEIETGPRVLITSTERLHVCKASCHRTMFARVDSARPLEITVGQYPSLRASPMLLYPQITSTQNQERPFH